MPYVCTGALGKGYEYGQPVPDAAEWPPHILHMHLIAGNIRNMSDEDAAAHEAAWRGRLAVARAKQLDRNLITAEVLLKAAQSSVKGLAEQLRVAETDLAHKEKAADEARKQLDEAKAALPPPPPSRPVAKTPPPAPKPEASPEPKSDEQLRKQLFIEASQYGRGELVRYAKAAKPEWSGSGRLIGSGYGIDLEAHAKGSKPALQLAFVDARLAQLKAEAAAKAEADKKPAQGQEPPKSDAPKTDEPKNQPKGKSRSA